MTHAGSMIRTLAVLSGIVCLASVGESTSLRVTHPEYARIRDVRILVIVSRTPSRPDRTPDQLADELEASLVALLAKHGVRVHKLVDDGPPDAPLLNVDVEVDQVRVAPLLAIVHARVELRELAKLERLKSISVCHRAVTWAQDDLEQVGLQEAEGTARGLVTAAVARLVDEIEYATEQGRAGRRTTR